MTYNFVIFNKVTLEVVGEVVTNHSVDLQYALYLLDAHLLKVDSPDDPDIMIDGKKYWSYDLDIMLNEDGDKIGKWSGTDIDIVIIGGKLYALNGWNGEKYLHCFECADRWNADPSGKEYEIAPVYDLRKWDEENECFEDGGAESIIGYEVL